MLIVLCNYHTFRSQQSGLRKEAQTLLVGSAVGVGRINKAEVTRNCRGIEGPQCQYGLAFMNLEPFGDRQAAEIRADRLRRGRRAFDEVHHAGSAAQRLDSDRSGAGEEVYPHTVWNTG